MKRYANNGEGGLSQCERSHINCFNLVSSPWTACYNYQNFRYFHQKTYLALFVFLMIKLDHWIISKKTDFTRINIWIWSKISMLIFATAFSQGQWHSTKYIFHLFLHIVHIPWIYLNRQKLGNESSANFACNSSLALKSVHLNLVNVRSEIRKTSLVINTIHIRLNLVNVLWHLQELNTTAIKL